MQAVEKFNVVIPAPKEANRNKPKTQSCRSSVQNIKNIIPFSVGQNIYGDKNYLQSKKMSRGKNEFSTNVSKSKRIIFAAGR